MSDVRNILVIIGWSLAVLGWGAFWYLLWAWKRVDATYPGRSLESLVREHGGARQVARNLKRLR